MKVKLTYFKWRTGKYYAGGEYETTVKSLDGIWDQVSKLDPKPGLAGDGRDFMVLVDVPEHEHNHPHIIPCAKMREAISLLSQHAGSCDNDGGTCMMHFADLKDGSCAFAVLRGDA